MMKEKINIAELLKDCPEGMELDCLSYDNVTLKSVGDKNTSFPIKVLRSDGFQITLTEYGEYAYTGDAKCIIYPKGKTTWEGFQRPFKDGDIIYVESKSYSPGLISIYKKENSLLFYDYCAVSLDGKSFYLDNIYGLIQKDKIAISRLATPEEKQKLFDAIKANGYKWDAETKTLEKLVEPRFKVGDNIVKRNFITNSCIVASVSSEYYGLKLQNGNECICVLPVSAQDEWELISDKFDIATLKPFESKVLVRSVDGDLWKPAIYGFSSHSKGCYVVGGVHWKQCIPYEENKHLLNTTNDCDDFYKTW